MGMAQSAEDWAEKLRVLGSSPGCGAVTPLEHHQGTKPPNAHMEPCNDPVTHSGVYSTFAHIQHHFCNLERDVAVKKKRNIEVITSIH